MYPLVRSRSRSRYSAISLVIESERECTGADTDTHVDTLLNIKVAYSPMVYSFYLFSEPIYIITLVVIICLNLIWNNFD